METKETILRRLRYASGFDESAMIRTDGHNADTDTSRPKLLSKPQKLKRKSKNTSAKKARKMNRK
jgi:hypothetical protein